MYNRIINAASRTAGTIATLFDTILKTIKDHHKIGHDQDVAASLPNHELPSSIATA